MRRKRITRNVLDKPFVVHECISRWPSRIVVRCKMILCSSPFSLCRSLVCPFTHLVADQPIVGISAHYGSLLSLHSSVPYPTADGRKRNQSSVSCFCIGLPTLHAPCHIGTLRQLGGCAGVDRVPRDSMDSTIESFIKELPQTYNHNATNAISKATKKRRGICATYTTQPTKMKQNTRYGILFIG